MHFIMYGISVAMVAAVAFWVFVATTVAKWNRTGGGVSDRYNWLIVPAAVTLGTAPSQHVRHDAKAITALLRRFAILPGCQELSIGAMDGFTQDDICDFVIAFQPEQLRIDCLEFNDNLAQEISRVNSIDGIYVGESSLTIHGIIQFASLPRLKTIELWRPKGLAASDVDRLHEIFGDRIYVHTFDPLKSFLRPLPSDAVSPLPAPGFLDDRK
jgi:hypothetical protein